MCFQAAWPSACNYLVSWAATQAETDRQRDRWFPNSAGALTGTRPRVLSLQDVALHSCLHRKQISNASILLPPTLLFVLGLYTLPSPHLGICYCSYAECLLLEMNNCCHQGLSTDGVSVHPQKKNRDLHNNGEQLGWSLSYLLLSNVPQSKGPETKSCHFCFTLEAVSCTGLAIYHTGSRKGVGLAHM